MQTEVKLSRVKKVLIVAAILLIPGAWIVGAIWAIYKKAKLKKQEPEKNNVLLFKKR